MRNKRKYKKLYEVTGILLAAFLMLSCTEDITIHTDNSEPVIVIYGILSDTLAYQSVTINKSSPYFDTQPNTGVSGAVVSIVDSNGKIYELFENDGSTGIYSSEYKWTAEPGLDYSLKVEVDFNSDGIIETYQANTSILPRIKIDNINIVPMNIMGNKRYAVNLYAEEPSGENFYLCKYLINDSLVSTKISKYQILDDVLFDGQYVDGRTLTYFKDISEKEKDTEEQRKRADYIESGDIIELQMSNISKAYFDFISQCQKEMRGSNPFFGGPPANITTNITNGGKGFFSGYCIDRASAETP